MYCNSCKCGMNEIKRKVARSYGGDYEYSNGTMREIGVTKIYKVTYCCPQCGKKETTEE